MRKLEIALQNNQIIDFAFENSIPEPNSGCWLWLGPVNSAGYGYMSDPRKPVNRRSASRTFVHRIVCECMYGKMDDDIFTRHTCDNTFCVNPNHLIPGTKLDNSKDAVERNKLASVAGESNPRAKLTEKDVLEIRSSEKWSSVALIAAKFHISMSLVRQIRNRSIWQHLAIVIFLAVPIWSYAEPPAGSDQNSKIGLWYKSLINPETGGSCCSIADCRPTKARVIDGHYQVWHETEWLPVPDEAILPHMENIIGEPVACVFNGTVLCLVRGPEG